MKKREKEKEKNPLHKQYGIMSNIMYILRSMNTYSKKFAVLIPLGVVCAPFMYYLWSFISKFVIDIITGENSTERLLFIMIIFTVIQIVSTVLNTYVSNRLWWMYIATRFMLLGDFNRKSMTINFEHLENPDVMDCNQKAANAAGSNDSGVEGMMHGIENMLKSIATVTVGLLIIGTMNVFVALLMIALAAVNFVIKNYCNKRCKKQVWDPLATWWRKSNYMSRTSTDFSCAKDIRMFGIARLLSDKYRELNRIRLDAQKTNAKIWFAASLFADVLWLISQAAVYAWLIYSVVMGGITIGNFSLYLSSSATFFTHISNLLDSVSNLFARSREVDDFRSFLDFDGGEKDGGKPVSSLDSYEFTFKNVSFKYPKAEKYALKDLNLTLKAGQRLAVVGLNGAGKSTFIKLLLRLYEPCEGEILLNGVNVKEYDRQSYYSLFSPVFQKVELFAFPLAENVSMKSPEDTDREFAKQCLVDAGMEEKLAELENGVDTEILKIIYDDGVDLSGGEKQKLALARALYKNAPVVVLDEPTAALDALAESKLYEDFDKLIGGKTAVYISHRLSSTGFCDNVAMFKDGRLCEYGTHKSLLEKGGEYAEMFRIQAQYYIENPEIKNPESEVTANA